MLGTKISLIGIVTALLATGAAGSFCRSGYFDLDSSTFLSFIQGRAAWTRSRIGNGNRLQCKGSAYCDTYDLRSAYCSRKGVFSKWLCSVTLPTNMTITDVNIECEFDPFTVFKCALQDSCVLFYKLEASSRFPWIVLKVIGGIAVAALIIGCMCGCCRRRRAARSTTTTTFVQNPPNIARPVYVVPPANAGISNVPMAYGNPQCPYPPQQTQIAAPMPATMQPYPPYAGAGAQAMPQPAMNPAFAGDYAPQNIHDPPPPYNTSAHGMAPR